MPILTRRDFLTITGASILLGTQRPVFAQKTSLPSVRRGIWPILLTPFTEAGKVDTSAIPEMIDFYVQAGCAGVFAGGMSSEIEKLSLEEMIEIARVAVRSAAGRINVAATGGFGATLEAQADALKRMDDTGVDAAVILTTRLRRDAPLGDQLLRLVDLTNGPLGLYEYPDGQERRVPPAELGRAAQSQRFFFMKDTSPEPAEVAAKAKAIQGTTLLLFNATLSRLPEMIAAGSDGHCGTAAIVCPELTAIASHIENPVAAHAALRALEAINSVMVDNAYPSSGKYLLERRGLHLGAASRDTSMGPLDEKARQTLDGFLKNFDFKAPAAAYV